MLDPDTHELLVKEAARNGLSVSAMVAVMVKAGLGSPLDGFEPNPMDIKLRKIIALAEREGLLDSRPDKP